MRGLGIWEVGEAALTRVAEGGIDLERHLEDWIEADPSLLREGLAIVGRQVHVQSGPLDLLALDPLGRWVVIELKRAYLDERAVMQVIDYAACLRELSAAEFRSKLDPYLESRGIDLDGLLEDRGAPDALDPERRELLLFVAGAGRSAGLERMVRFLSERYEVPISSVALQVFELPDGRKLLVREVTEGETSVGEPETSAGYSVDAVLELAERFATKSQFERAIQVAAGKHLRVHPWKTSLMFTPPSNRRRCLFTIWAEPGDDGLQTWVEIEAFTEYFDLERAAVEKALGPKGWRAFDEAGLDEFLRGLESLDLST